MFDVQGSYFEILHGPGAGVLVWTSLAGHVPLLALIVHVYRQRISHFVISGASGGHAVIFYH